jgi:hypothetical protein
VAAYGLDFALVDGKKQRVRKVIVWDAVSGNILREVHLDHLQFFQENGKTWRGVLGEARFSPDAKSLYVLGTQYQNQGEQLATVIHVYDLLEDDVRSYVADRVNRITRIGIHPEKPNTVACIYMNKDLQHGVGYLNLSDGAGVQQLKTYKHPWIPLVCDFSTVDQRLYVGTGGGSRSGTLEIFNMANNKLLRTLTLRENVTRVLEDEQRVYVVGENQTWVYRKSNFFSLGTNRNLMEQVLPDEQAAVLAPKTIEEMKKIRLQDLVTSRILSWDVPFAVVRAQCTMDARHMLALVEKDEFNPATHTQNVPSVLIITRSE